MNKPKIISCFFAVTVISIAAIAYLYPKVNPLYSVNHSRTIEEIVDHAGKIVKELNIDTEGYEARVKLVENKPLIRQLQSKFSIEESNELLAESVPAINWQVKWNKVEDQRVFLTANNEEKIAKAIVGEFSLSLDQNMNLVKLNLNFPDSVQLPRLSKEEAEALAGKFLKKYSRFKGFQSETNPTTTEDSILNKSFSYSNSTGMRIEQRTDIKQGSRTDYIFNYSSVDPVLKNKVEIKISTAGDVVSGYELEYKVPEQFQKSGKLFKVISSIVIYLLLFVLTVYFAFKRFRDYEIGFKTGVIIGIVTAVFFAFNLYLTLQTSFRLEFLIGMVVGGLFIGAAAAFSFAVAESLGREIFKEKFYAIDLKLKGHAFHSKVGRSLLNGLGGGLAAAAVFMLLIYLINQFANFSIIPFQDDDNAFNSTFPFFSLLFGTFISDIFEISLMFLLLSAVLKNWFKPRWLAIVIPAFCWALAIDSPVEIWYLRILTQLVVGFAIAFILFKTDVMSALIALLTYNVSFEGFGYILDPGQTDLNGYLLIAIFILLIGFAVFAILTKDSVKDLNSITPAFAQHITERQRMQRQLEIAREVQMSFLPDETPEIAGLEIAAKCDPAYEVGGDYYDFIKLGNSKIGVAIGDVSGKGTQAAFYMTLTKGFLKALAKTNNSPADVLSRMNELFYENVERGHFVSMIYGIFDLEGKKLTVARAGHNPLIIKNSKDSDVRNYQSMGLALGLEKGEIFRQTIKEETIPLESGDQIVFYTDGFTEAMNKQNEEYGEKQLAAIINEHSESSPGELIDLIIQDVNKFIGKAKQHDDMTIVAVKLV